MKWTLRFFALLDVISIVLTKNQIFLQINSFFTNESFTPVEFFSRILFIAMWISLFASAIFLSIPKKAGIMIYYFQVPIRIIFLTLSVGFISMLSYLTNWEYITQALMSLIIFVELLRIYVSYKAQKDLF